MTSQQNYPTCRRCLRLESLLTLFDMGDQGETWSKVAENVLPLSAMAARQMVPISSISQPVEICRLTMRKPLGMSWSRYFGVKAAKRPVVVKISAAADDRGGRAEASVGGCDCRDADEASDDGQRRR